MLVWVLFTVFILALIAIDLGLFHREASVLTTRQAMRFTAFWVFLGLSFTAFIYLLYQGSDFGTDLHPRTAAVYYLTGYLLELSLSLDNVFVIALIFNYFKVPELHRHRLLFWGILGALVFRITLILLGVWLLERFDWLFYIFGVFLLYSAVKMLRSDEDVEPSRNAVVLFFKRFFPVTKQYYEGKFFVRRRHLLAATPLFIALIVIETTDILFAFDSIPAILSVTTDPFLVFSSNAFAILGLRSLYFVLAALMDTFSYLRYALAGILFFIGLKMLAHNFLHLPEWFSLVVIAALLLGGILFSVWKDGQLGLEQKEEQPS